MRTALEKRSGEGIERVSPRRVVAPPSDVYENDDEYLIYADIPGVSSEGLEIRLDADRLTIHGRAELPGGENGSASADYERRFAIPDDIDRDKVSASLNAGVLELHLPKSEASKPRRIHIKGSN